MFVHASDSGRREEEEVAVAASANCSNEDLRERPPF